MASCDPTLGDPTPGGPTLCDSTPGGPTLGDPTPGDPSPCDPALWLRAVRRERGLSQRELAAGAGVPPSTVAEIESGRRAPGLRLFARLLAAGGYALQPVDTNSDPPGRPLQWDAQHDAVRDRGGRRFPAHLTWGGKPDYWTMTPSWWGWGCVAWYWADDPAVPDHVYWHRPRPQPSRLGREPREHPFWN